MTDIFAFNRRQMLVGAGFMGLSALYPARLLATPRFSLYPFTLGVASGDPWPDSVVLWTRLAPEPLAEHGGMEMVAVPVQWEIAEDAAFTKAVQKGEALARPELGHSVHVEVQGLKPAREYFYRFFIANGDATPVARTRTAPAHNSRPDRLRVALAGCQHYEAGYFTAYRHLSNEDLDCVYMYGDYIYEGAGGRGGGSESGGSRQIVRNHVGGEIYSLDDYRRRYAQYHLDADLQAAHHAVPFICAFDDHEVDNDWADLHEENGAPAQLFAMRRAMALQAWYENLPVRQAQIPMEGRVQMYRRLDFGNLVRMHVTDNRSHRDQQLCDARKKTPCRTADTEAASVFGARQEAWLGEGLVNPMRWNMMAQQAMVMPYDLRKEGASEPWSSSDDWMGYPGARKRYKTMITDRKLTNVVIACGNSHRHIAAHIPSDDADWTSKPVAVEFMSSSISSSGDSDTNWRSDATLRLNPHQMIHEMRRGYTIHDIRQDRWTTTMKAMDHVGRPGGNVRELAKFVVLPHEARINRA